MSTKKPSTAIAHFGIPLWQQFGERGLFGKPYIRMGPMFSSVGWIMFQKGGLLGYGLRGHSDLLCKFLFSQDSEYDNETKLQNGLKPVGDDLLSKTDGEPNNLFELFLLPELRDSGIDLKNPDFVTGKKKKWIDEKIDPTNGETLTYLFFQRGASIGFFHSSLFCRCWHETYRKRDKSEWTEAYERKIVSKPVQQELDFSQEVSNILSESFKWCKGNPNSNLNIKELTELKRLSQKQVAPEE